MKVIYIAGYGRSGSTILELIVSQAEGVVALGEVVQIDKYGPASTFCTCGKKVSACDFYDWAPKCRSEKFSNKAFYAVQALLYLIKAKPVLSDSVKAIVTHFPENAVLVDSSKSTFYSLLRPIEYRRAGAEVIIIYNVRSFSETFRSLLKGTNKDLEAGRKVSSLQLLCMLPLRLISFLVFGRLSYSFMKLIFGSRIKLVNYNEWVEHPERVLAELSTYIPIQTEKIVHKISKRGLYVDHSIAGNRLRSSMYGDFVFLFSKKDRCEK